MAGRVTRTMKEIKKFGPDTHPVFKCEENPAIRSPGETEWICAKCGDALVVGDGVVLQGRIVIVCAKCKTGNTMP